MCFNNNEWFFFFFSCDRFMKSRNENRSQTPSIEKSPRGAWRQAIFHRVQTPVRQKIGKAINFLNIDCIVSIVSKLMNSNQ